MKTSQLAFVTFLAAAACGVQSQPTSQPVIPVPTEAYTIAHEGNFVVGPTYANAPELEQRPDVMKGNVSSFVMDSKDSKFYPGIHKEHPGQVVPYTRKVWVYLPAQYVAGSAAPFIICQDANHRNELPTILDNMIHDHRLPPMVAIFISNGGGDSFGSERGLEYDTVSGKYAEFVQEEVLPRVEKETGVKLSTDPDARATLGCSSGAACAFTMAWSHPEWYHRVLSYSGTYVNQQSPANPGSPHGAWEYHEHLIPTSDAKPLRIWMEVGEHDLREYLPEDSYHNWVLANGRMADALKAKGYHYQFVFARDAKHCDGRVMRQTLPAAMEWLWQDYAKK